MAKYRFDVDVPDGMHLSYSRKDDGGMSALLRDDETNKIVDHAVLQWPDDDDDDDHDQSEYGYQDGSWPPPEEDSRLSPEEIEAAIELLGQALSALIHGIEIAAPHVNAWWKESARPKVRAASARIRSSMARLDRRSKAVPDDPPTELVKGDDSVVAEHSAAIVDFTEGFAHTMTRVEAQQRFIDAVVAMAFAHEQMQLLQNVRIVGDGVPLEVEKALEALTPQDAEQAIRQLLESNPRLLDAHNLTAIQRNLGVGLGPEPVRLQLRSLGSEQRDRGVQERTEQ